MSREIHAIPDVTRKLLADHRGAAKRAGERLRALDPALVTTIARGSSDHAAAYLKYAIELTCGIPVASTGPSVSSVYGRGMKLPSAATFAISQSGKSPDIVDMARTAGKGGSQVISLSNSGCSPLVEASGEAVDICAGPELSVAATKTFVASIAAGLLVLAHWREDEALLSAIGDLPEAFERAVNCNWGVFEEAIYGRQDKRDSLYVLGRGPSFAIAKECALKFKETCQLHAEAYSAAEVLHGPVSIAREGFPILALASRDESESGVVEVADQLAGRGVQVFITSDMPSAARKLPFATGGHPLTDPLVQVVSFYAFVERLARRLGLDPDKPPHLNKVTETV